ncbi:group 3 secretory phospholipase A2-like [Dicentrarchus labrax]|nr:group 3 secretory phospholipase A2-like [Dicentrarchus labrax]
MQSRYFLQLLFALSWLIVSMARDVIGSGHSCLTSSPADDGLTRVTFLREDAPGAHSLYLSLWSEDMRPVTCEVNTDPLVTERYLGLCGRSGTQGGEIPQRFNISMLLAPDAPCALVSSSAPELTRRRRSDGTEAKSRRKRSWIFPGTLWCGTGSKAVGYDQLGMFESTDRCCREHDHCLHVIPAFTRNYGVFNSKFFTVSHCDCDQRFRQCLIGANDTIASMVGYSFFSILQVPCFELKEQRRCTEMYWWGMCKVANNAPYAVFKSPLPFNTTDVTSQSGDNANNNKLKSSMGQRVTESPVMSTESPKHEHRCSYKDSPRGDIFYRRRTKGKGCKRHWKLYTAATQIPPTSRAHATTPSNETSLVHASKSSASMSNKKRAGRKKNNRKGLSARPTQRSHVPPRVSTSSIPQNLTTEEPTLQLHLPTAITAVTKTTKRRKNVPKKGHCCGFRMPLRGDTFQPHCKSCLERNMTTVTPSITTSGLPIKVTSLDTLKLKKTKKKPSKQDTLKPLWSTTTSAAPATRRLKTAAAIQKVGKPQKQSHLLRNNTSQEPMGRTKATNTHTDRGLKPNVALHKGDR